MNASSRQPDISAATWIVIAAFNEEEVIEQVAGGVRAVYPNVIVVDDGSADETRAAAARSGAVVMRHLINRGQGASLQTGIELALKRGAEYIVTFDADGQHRVEDIASLLAPIATGEVDIALGSRFLGENAVDLPAGRKFVLKLGVLFTRIVNRVKVTDAHNGLRAFSRRAAERMTITADRMAHASEIIDLVRRANLPYKEIPVQIRYNEYSLQKGQSSRGALRIVFHYLMSRIFE